jgi:hypothetical protein
MTVSGLTAYATALLEGMKQALRQRPRRIGPGQRSDPPHQSPSALRHSGYTGAKLREIRARHH